MLGANLYFGAFLKPLIKSISYDFIEYTSAYVFLINGFNTSFSKLSHEEQPSSLIIKTKPKAGSTRKKGDTIIIIESSGGIYNYLENYVGLKYAEVKAKRTYR